MSSNLQHLIYTDSAIEQFLKTAVENRRISNQNELGILQEFAVAARKYVFGKGEYSEFTDAILTAFDQIETFTLHRKSSVVTETQRTFKKVEEEINHLPTSIMEALNNGAVEKKPGVQLIDRNVAKAIQTLNDKVYDLRRYWITDDDLSILQKVREITTRLSPENLEPFDLSKRSDGFLTETLGRQSFAIPVRYYIETLASALVQRGKKLGIADFNDITVTKIRERTSAIRVERNLGSARRSCRGKKPGLGDT